VTSVRFSPNSAVPLLFTASLDKTLRLFQIDGIRNSKVQSLHFNDLPVHRAEWMMAGRQIVATGRRKHFYCFDLESEKLARISGVKGRDERSLETFAVSSESDARPLLAFSGRDGYAFLVDGHNKQWVGQVKMAHNCRALAFGTPSMTAVAAAGSPHLFTLSESAEVYVWDIRNQRRCVARHRDEGSLHGTALAVSRCGALCAIGSDSGVVNVYSTRALLSGGEGGSDSQMQQTAAVMPLKSLMQLTTPIDTIAFNGATSMLVFGSARKKDSLRLAHVETMTCFENWPTSRTPLHYVSSAAFSPGSAWLSIANSRGRALLYRLNHFSGA
jgi:U3 small nucleolar RNA-associated protein 18